MIENLILKTLLMVFGIGAVSGILYDDSKLYLIDDIYPNMIVYDFNNKKTTEVVLVEELQKVAVDKKNKADFESITHTNQEIFIFGSGSAKNRNDLFVIRKKDWHVERFSIEKLYQNLAKKHQIPLEEFNIEGAVIDKNTVYLFQRGNGKRKLNGVFVFPKDYLFRKENPQNRTDFHPVHLPEKKGFQYGFSDAVLHNQQIYFTATAEGALSTYHDGEVLGSIIGLIDMKSFEVHRTEMISSDLKVEGLTVKSENKNQIEFYLAYDNDSGEKKSEILTYVWKK
ncbi:MULTISPECIES: DUF6929 family protein [Weeksella]|uniref:Phytase-like domain-containing protein n=1 Tax=Weeksella virosa (strain ATCC 43766 / DSM 16922 / JCM 21250 / CCUG 30538 / CDC 9751 / IAM 14551 / NBRC 16016 / NCTC 11634 / CL345/78) TaxID=865938 RepID=F0P0M0_WEEVC|nr:MULTISPECIES: hypothetical protein [Weeksella]ADX68519.1 hypothetical protein Weevi_1829 [Weeksella virosa DSM 16922]MDK7375419.1 hypothetical protein [Weeksella virosa]